MSMAMKGDSNDCRDEEEDQTDLRRGPWTCEEDNLLIQYIARHGEGRWNLLAKCAGLKRTGKSCRLRWLNYLKPDVKRGNLTPQEQLLILELHHKWGNRWSKIAQHLPGRTDNEIKNYWRTRVQKQARQLNIESNSKTFIDAVRYFWMPRLLHKMNTSKDDSSSSLASVSTAASPSASVSPNKVNDHQDTYSTYCSNHNYYETTSSSATSPTNTIVSPELRKVEQPEIPQGLIITSQNNVGVDGASSYYPNLDESFYFMDNPSCFDVDYPAATSSAGNAEVAPLGFFQMDQESNYHVGNDIGDGFWTTMDGIW